MYSGITGEEFHADIYLGLVYYQRLRHMVNDKFQVRTTGPVDPLTRQPVKVSMPLFSTRVALSTHVGPKARGWYPIRRDGERRSDRARNFVPVARSIDELFRLLDRLGVQKMRQSRLPWIRRDQRERRQGGVLPNLRLSRGRGSAQSSGSGAWRDKATRQEGERRGQRREER